jgi:diacylglycerol kinase family enzyme
MVHSAPTEQQPSEQPAIEYAVVVANEHSSNARRMRRQIDQLTIPHHVITTSRDPRRTQDDLYDGMKEGAVLLGAGGDGTNGQIVNMLLSPEGVERGLHKERFIPLRGGNANDFATMLNDHNTAAQILERGRDIYLHPLEVRKVDSGEPSRFAAAYFSALATAAASERLDQIKNTANHFTKALGLQLGREGLATVLEVGGYKPAQIQRDGQEAEAVTDYLMARGDRMGKVGRPHAELDKPAFEAIATKDTGYTKAVVNLGKMARGNLHGDMRTSTEFTVTSVDGSEIPVQYDGEAEFVPSGSTFSVGISETPYRTLSTRL